jgi:hypothetical protein
MATTAPDKQRDARSSRSPTRRTPISDHQRGAVHVQGGRRLAPLTGVVTVVVIVAALAAWVLFVRSGDDLTGSGRAATSPAAAPQGPKTDPVPVNPWAVNEPMLVVQGYVESLNRGDTAGALAAFDPDAELISPGCQPTCVGITAIAPVLEQASANRGELTLTDPRVEGDTLTANFSLASQEFPADVQRVTGSTSAIVRNQRIVHLSMYWDPTDPQTATVLNTSTPPNTEWTPTSTIDLISLWHQLATLAAPDRDNLVAGLAPNMRADLARIAEVAAAAAVIR